MLEPYYERFEVCAVDVERRCYRVVSRERRYVDARIAADTLRAVEGGDAVVTDREEGRRVLYDSRTFGSKVNA